MPIRVLLADDSSIVRMAISRLLQSDPEVGLVAEAISYSETEQLVNRLRPQVVVMDIHMRDIHPTIISELKSSLTGICLIAISLADDAETKVLADALGAVILLDKMNLAAELLPAIKRFAASSQHARSIVAK
jgi:DNA-binding NarL/FixJ family response regulator